MLGLLLEVVLPAIKALGGKLHTLVGALWLYRWLWRKTLIEHDADKHQREAGEENRGPEEQCFLLHGGVPGQLL